MVLIKTQWLTCKLSSLLIRWSNNRTIVSIIFSWLQLLYGPCNIVWFKYDKLSFILIFLSSKWDISLNSNGFVGTPWCKALVLQSKQPGYNFTATGTINNACGVIGTTVEFLPHWRMPFCSECWFVQVIGKVDAVTFILRVLIFA